MTVVILTIVHLRGDQPSRSAVHHKLVIVNGEEARLPSGRGSGRPGVHEGMEPQEGGNQRESPPWPWHLKHLEGGEGRGGVTTVVRQEGWCEGASDD